MAIPTGPNANFNAPRPTLRIFVPPSNTLSPRAAHTEPMEAFFWMPTRLNIPEPRLLTVLTEPFPTSAHDRCAARFMSVAMVPPLVAAVLAMVAPRSASIPPFTALIVVARPL